LNRASRCDTSTREQVREDHPTNMSLPQPIHGKCHCGNVVFELDWPGDTTEIPARACGCSFCVKHGGVWTSSPKARLAVTIRDRGLVSSYAFGTRTATFHVCSRCGAVPIVTSEIDGRTYAVVNVNTFDNVDPASLRRAATDFEGEGLESRLGRRKRNWIAAVQIRDAGDSPTTTTVADASLG
jgi:hypothetical protein